MRRPASASGSNSGSSNPHAARGLNLRLVWMLGTVETAIITTDLGDMVLEILLSRSPGSTVCPSEVARAIAPGAAWRDAMPAVHSAVDRLFDEGAVRISWKGQSLATRAGPYRIGRAPRG